MGYCGQIILPIARRKMSNNDWPHTCNRLAERLSLLKEKQMAWSDLDIQDRLKVQAAILNFSDYLQLVEEFLIAELDFISEDDEVIKKEITSVITIYKRHLSELRKNEGVNFYTADASANILFGLRHFVEILLKRVSPLYEEAL